MCGHGLDCGCLRHGHTSGIDGCLLHLASEAGVRAYWDTRVHIVATRAGDRGRQPPTFDVNGDLDGMGAKRASLANMMMLSRCGGVSSGMPLAGRDIVPTTYPRKGPITMLTRTRKAFTMLELIVVIVILGILALLAIPTFNAVIGRAKDSNVQAAATSYERNLRALAGFDEAAPNRGTDVITVAGELEGVTMLATNGFDNTGANPDGNTVGVTAGTIKAVVLHVQFTQDGSVVCLTLGTASGVAGTVADNACATI